jgi:hypothetical protein
MVRRVSGSSPEEGSGKIPHIKGFRIDLQMIERAPGMGALCGALGRKGRPAAALQRPGPRVRSCSRCGLFAGVDTLVVSWSTTRRRDGRTCENRRAGHESYDELRARIGQPETIKVVDDSCTTCQATSSCSTNGPTSGTFAWTDAVDDGGWRAFVPVTDDLMIAPDGSFVDE